MTKVNIDSIRPEAGDDMPIPPRRAWLHLGIPLLLIAGTAALLLGTGWDLIRVRREVRAVPVGLRTIEVEASANPAREGGVAVQAPGWVEPDPYDIFVSALTDGVVQDILVLEGDHLEAGQPVALLIDDDARLQLRGAEAMVAEQRGRLAIEEATLVAAELDLRELVFLDRRVSVAEAEQSRIAAELAGFPARRAGLEATKAEKKDEYDRKRRVVESGAVPEGPVIRLGIRLQAIDAQIKALDAEEAAVEAKLRAADAEAMAADRARELLVDENLAVAAATGRVEIARGELDATLATLDAARLRLERCTVRTPVAGVVIERLTSPGSRLSFGDGPHTAHVVHLFNPRELQIRADIPLADAAGVGVGQSAEIVIDLLPDTVFRGSVTRFLHRADIAKNTIEAKIRIEDPSPLLKPDMLARVRILEAAPDESEGIVMRRATRIFVPADAIENGMAWVIAEREGNRGTARRRPVEVGPRIEDGWIEIVDGLRPGDLVIVDETPLDGEAVRIRSDDEEVRS